MDITELRKKIGNTKICHLTSLEKANDCRAYIYGKDESTNMTGSIKDRPAFQMVESAIKKGILKKDSIIIEPTSGNTGISLAYIGKQLGYKVIIIMPSSMSVERRNMIKSFGGELLLVDGTMSDCIAKANELKANDSHYVILGQFDNYDCVIAHEKYTGPEIINDLPDVDAVVMGIGTGGTISGVGKFMKENYPEVKIIGVEPLQSPFINKGIKGPHKIQGIGAGFIPKNYLAEYVDEVLMIDGDEAIKWAKELHEKENIFVGISSGAALAGALILSQRIVYKGKRILAIFPDAGDRYQWK